MSRNELGGGHWDPLPDVLRSAGPPLLGDPAWAGGLAEPVYYLRGKWADRNWRNVPGPLYGAETDTCWDSRRFAPHHVSYEGDTFQEFLFRPPGSRTEVLSVLRVADNDPMSGWAYDGDEHWTLDLVREWWGQRSRLTEWIERDLTAWSMSRNSVEVEACQGLREYADYVGGDLELYLRNYAFWLEERRHPAVGESVPDL